MSPIFCGARRHDQVLVADRVVDVDRGEALRAQRVGLQVDLDLARRAAVRIGNRGARDRRDLRRG